ncbi:hypothetical protein FA15DRAFT_759449 [Coprinopsis marcescibilis]|uniref:RING-type domain-containing protein n=1 Tax=Coprinopsis marcescibilis TaxID=230819 RepID=A0A5C3KKD9_COPMA|nr:hypothetical protein FA15DRAFT_759449 [Coprinopsis marcescibilis]
MALSAVAKGKKRAIEGTEPDTPAPVSPAPVVKRSKSRAETRPCPICNEHIPLRLLGRHAVLEAERVENIIRHIGSVEPFYDDRHEQGPSNLGRRSALKARQSIASRTSSSDALYEVNKTLQSIKRHRKQRHGRLKEMIKEEEDNYTRRDAWTRGTIGGQIVCPICSQTIRGDQGVLDAHVDACVANESRRLEEVRQAELALQQSGLEESWETLSNVSAGGQYAGNVQGAGFHTRNNNSEDVEDDIDIDGDDQAVYGETQFTEGDVLPIPGQRPTEVEDEDIDVEDVSDNVETSERPDHTPNTTDSKERERSFPSHIDEGLGRIQLAIEVAKKKGDKSVIISNLESKVKLLESLQAPSSAPTCRICLDPYDEPTLSTGCWHTCCRECWLRCLGSTRQCPICKRITVAADLRRIYL